jgi:hypothetical protein
MQKVNVTYSAIMGMLSRTMSMPNIAKKAFDIAEEISKLVVAKNHDYGDAWQKFGLYTPLTRINDKMLRVQTLSGGEQALVADEKIEDTLKDIIGYAALALLWLKENGNEEKHDAVQLSMDDLIIADYRRHSDTAEELQ